MYYEDKLEKKKDFSTQAKFIQFIHPIKFYFLPNIQQLRYSDNFTQFLQKLKPF